MQCSRAELGALEDQRNLIQRHVEKKEATEKQSKALQKALGDMKNLLLGDILPFSKRNTDDLLAYCSLTEEIISLLDLYCFNLAQGHYTRVRNGIMLIHDGEAIQLLATQGAQVAQYLKDEFLASEKINHLRLPKSCQNAGHHLFGMLHYQRFLYPTYFDRESSLPSPGSLLLLLNPSLKKQYLSLGCRK
jgi:hypothetical protein